ncbi:NPC intracellular cholesterol transporter 2 homolog a-like [Musca vetustissima]|uniref:NPC intracellular cholesterol transporter 2 homolog a-like n=1 Tax=Musca vetustissima TaxID=27455 RepID=UPI002AB60A39|nr:NPC intracellular cholesterol transporter 2 homolog a-like [Musca vetustissima]
MKYVILTIVALMIAGIGATDVKECKKGQPFPLDVEVVGCEEMPCDIVKGTTIVMYVHFVGTKDNIRELNAVVHATTLGITVPYELPKEVASVCDNLMYGAICPIDKTEDVVYKFNFYVESTYPEIPVSIQISLIDAEGDSIACFVCNIKVKKGATKPLLLE